MIDVLIFPDFETGRVYPTFKMAQNLKNAGYRVAYIGIPNVMKTVAKQGFETHVIFEDLYPEGCLDQVKANGMVATELEDLHIPMIVKGKLDTIFNQLKPELLVCSGHVLLESLAFHYRYGFKQVTYWPHLPFNIADQLSEANLLVSDLITELGLVKVLDANPNTLKGLMMILKEEGAPFTSMAQLVAPMRKWANLMLYPKAFEINRTVDDSREIYLGPGLLKTVKKTETELAAFLPKKKQQQLIFASMETQAAMYPEKATKVFNLLVECMQQPQLANFHLTLAVGGFVGHDAFHNLPENISVHNWVPQIDVLQYASMAIISAGLELTKECIAYDVPILAIPMGGNQYDNAMRIDHHKLGLEVDIDNANIPQVLDLILRVNHVATFREGLAEMRKIFLEEDAKQLEVQFVKAVVGAPFGVPSAQQ